MLFFGFLKKLMFYILLFLTLENFFSFLCLNDFWHILNSDQNKGNKSNLFLTVLPVFWFFFKFIEFSLFFFRFYHLKSGTFGATMYSTLPHQLSATAQCTGHRHVLFSRTSTICHWKFIALLLSPQLHWTLGWLDVTFSH